LGKVGILEFIHQNVFKFMRPGGAGLRIGAQNLVGKHQHVIKVHGVVAHQQLLITQVELAHFFIPEVLDRIVFRRNQVVFRAGDGVKHGFSPEQLLVQAGFTNDFLHQGNLVIHVKDDKILAKRQQVCFPAQDAPADRMKGAQPDALGCRAQNFLHARPHFFSGFVGKSYRENVIGRHVQHANQVSDAVRQDAGFAGARACQHERRPGGGSHSALLLGI